MPQPVIFYSWQSDTPRESTRDAIRVAIEMAISRISTGIPLEDSPRMDSDTQGHPGTPSITETIFEKIRESSILIADVTMAGATVKKEGVKEKKLPNPNVMLELGYGAATLGWQRIILLLNKHYGSPESLPFDLKFRRFPFTYNLTPKSGNREAVIEDLANNLSGAISVCLGAESRLVQTTTSKLLSQTRSLISRIYNFPSIFETFPVPTVNAPLSRDDMAFAQLMELGMVLCYRTPETQVGWSYAWTNLGKQCIAHLGFPTHPVDFTGWPGSDRLMLVDLSQYELLDLEKPEENEQGMGNPFP
jgi:hypothetical protein